MEQPARWKQQNLLFGEATWTENLSPHPCTASVSTTEKQIWESPFMEETEYTDSRSLHIFFFWNLYLLNSIIEILEVRFF